MEFIASLKKLRYVDNKQNFGFCLLGRIVVVNQRGKLKIGSKEDKNKKKKQPLSKVEEGTQSRKKILFPLF